MNAEDTIECQREREKKRERRLDAEKEEYAKEEKKGNSSKSSSNLGKEKVGMGGGARACLLRVGVEIYLSSFLTNTCIHLK